MKTLTYIQWCDAISNERSWMSLEEAIEWAKTDSWIIDEVGWILEETDEYIVFASRIADVTNGKPETVGGVFKIPTTWILNRKEIKSSFK
jgi:hypothetical protein